MEIIDINASFYTLDLNMISDDVIVSTVHICDLVFRFTMLKFEGSFVFHSQGSS